MTAKKKFGSLKYFSSSVLPRRSSGRNLFRKKLGMETLEQRAMLSISQFTGCLPTQVDLHQLGGYLSGPASGSPLEIATNYLKANASQLGLTADDFLFTKVTDQYTDSDTGITHIYLRQQFQGLDVANTSLAINITSDGRVINVGGGFVPGLNSSVSQALGVPAWQQPFIGPMQELAFFATTPNMSAAGALSSVANSLGLSGTSETIVASSECAGGTTLLQNNAYSLDPIPAKLQYVPVQNGGVVLAWNYVLRTPDGEHWYEASADSSLGSMVKLSDWVDHASYNVFARPLENPDDGPRTIETDPADRVASPFGWHDTNGTAGAEYTDTRGNNVYAQEDRDDNDTGGVRPDGGTGLNFDFPFDPTKSPLTNQNAAITNLFYWNNILHDVHFNYGFTEVAGNFQEKNYTNTGKGSDPVQADAQDGSGTNNANFATPPDGMDPRMQMYNFTLTNPNRDGDFESVIIIHEYGHGVSNRVVGGPADAGALDALQSGGMGEGWSDWWGLMFTQKTTDQKMDKYPVGTYVFGEPLDGAGIRRFPYSYDMAVNPLTYGDIRRNPEVHDMGEVWCSALWDMNWLLIDRYGFNPDISKGYTPGGEGNLLALKLVMDSMKLMAANPTYLNGRDAMLLADQNLTGGANQTLIWTAFARRGMGFNAKDGGDPDSTRVTENFDMPPSPKGEVRFSYDSYAVGSTVTITVHDGDLLNSPSCKVTVTSSNDDSETLDLQPQGGGDFRGTIVTSSDPAKTSDNKLEVVVGGTITVSYVDANDGSGKSVTVTDQAGIHAPIQVTSQTLLPMAEQDAFYTTTLTATGGVGNYVWTFNTGDLPEGVTLSNSGVLSGTPTTARAGGYDFSVTIADSNPPDTITASFHLDVKPLPPSDLIVSKTHSGIFMQGDTGLTYKILVTNIGLARTTAEVTLVDVLPTGLTATAFSGTGWKTDLATLTAKRSDPLKVGESYPELTLTVDVSFTAPLQIVNSVRVSGGGELETSNSAADDPTTIAPIIPVVRNVSPSLDEGNLTAGTSTLAIRFNEPMLGAEVPLNYELRSVGPDGLLGTADDVISHPIGATFKNMIATVDFGAMVENVYRLTLLDSITSLDDTPLDGDRDGVPGGDWIADFVVVPGTTLLSPATTTPTGKTPRALTSGDFNGDGTLDLAVANSGDNTVQIFLNTNGRFTTENSHFTSGYVNPNSSAVPFALVTGDFNGDGKLDLASANYDSIYKSGNVQVFLGNGDGTFQVDPSRVTQWANGNPVSLAAADFNGDGKLDLVAANVHCGAVTVLTGTGDGSFSGFQNYGSGGSTPLAVTTADFNGDGKIDIAVANDDNGTIGILKNKGNGTFPTTALTYLTAGTHPNSLAVGDFNGDGKIDIVAGNYGVENGNLGGIGILLNKGNGTYPSVNTSYATGGDHPCGVAVADFDGDGKSDIAVANSLSNSVGVLLSDGTGKFFSVNTFASNCSCGPQGINVGDFDGDGRHDLAVTNTSILGSGDSVGVLSNIYGTAPEELTTPRSFIFDIATGSFGLGEFVQGTNNAFDGYGRLFVGGTAFRPAARSFAMADENQTLLTASGKSNGLTVSRKITVPNTGNFDFARTRDVFFNSNGSEITTTVQIVGNLGSDSHTTLFATSSGDTILTPDDLWFGTKGASGPALIHYFRAVRGLKPLEVKLVDDNVVWTFELTVPAGQTRELGYFTIQANDETDALNQANGLMTSSGFSDEAKKYLTPTELASLVNFQFNHAPTDVSLTNRWVLEEQPGAVVGKLQTTDPDLGETFTYSLLDDPTNKFEIVGDTLQLKAGESLDCETTPQVTLRIRSTDLGGLSFDANIDVVVEDVTELMTYTASNSNGLLNGVAGLLLRVEGDGRVHLRSESLQDLVSPMNFGKVSGVQIVGRDQEGDVLTVDPKALGLGVTFQGGSGDGDALVLQGSSDDDQLTMTTTQIQANGRSPLLYTGTEHFVFELGAGSNSLLLDHATLNLDRDNAISAGTKVTVSGGVLNFNGHPSPLGDLTVLDGGRVQAPTLSSTATSVVSGTLSVTSLVCDTLTIGAPATAAFASEAPAPMAEAVRLSEGTTTSSSEEVIDTLSQELTWRRLGTSSPSSQEQLRDAVFASLETDLI